MNCPYTGDGCVYIDTAGETMMKECHECEHYKFTTFTAEQLLNLLPGTIIRDRKKIFRYKEVYDLNITKDALNNWVITYMNVMDLHVLFSISSNELTKCLNITVKWLVENKYIIT